jgi:hypothetical protein
MIQEHSRKRFRAMDDPRALSSRLALALVPALYTLSVGPAFYFVERTGNGVDAMRTVYAPLLWLRNNTPLRTPLDWYFEMWKHAAR